MPISVNVDGPCQILVGTGASDALEELGYTIDGAQVSQEVMMSDVPGDQNGGSDGIPIDIQYFGETHHVTLELSKYDPAIVAKLSPRLKGGTDGTLGAVGSLVAGGVKYFRLLLKPTPSSPVRPRNYLAAVPRGAFEINKGTKFSRLRLEFTCYPVEVSGVWTIWNTTTS